MKTSANSASSSPHVSTRKASHLTILGAGIAGLGTGYYCKKNRIPFTIYEEKAEVGGNCVTFHHDGFSFDSGSHRFHNLNPEITREIMSLLGDDLREIHVPSKLYFQGKYYRFPLAPLDILRNLGIPKFFIVCQEIIRARLSKRAGSGHSFQEFALFTYGKTLASSFLLNYTEKLWGRDTKNLSPTIARMRLKGLDIRSLLAETFLGHKAKTRHLDGSFYYPVQGIGMVPDKLSEYCGTGNVITQARITKIFHGDNRINAVEINGRIKESVEGLVSTLPLSLFIKMMDPPPQRDIMDLVQTLQYRSLILVVFFIQKESIMNSATVYFPHPDFPFTRIYEPRNRSRSMAPPGKTSLVAEIPCDPRDEQWNKDDEELKHDVGSRLVELGWMDLGQILDSKVIRIEYAYPILETDTEKNVKTIIEYLENFTNLNISGRNGRFMYTSIHDSLSYSRDLVGDLL